MQSESYSFPHPVLGNSDDFEGQFDVDISISRNSLRRLVLNLDSIHVTNSYIADLIAQGMARYVIKVYCSSTIRTWTFSSPFDLIEIDENQLINRVEIQCFIICDDELKKFGHSTVNKEFMGQSFHVQKNDIIGITGKITIPIEKDFEKLGFGNIFKFYAHETEKPMYFDLNHDKIFVYYPITKDGEHPHKALFKKNPWVAYSIYIVPALAEALRYMSEEEENAKDWEWYNVIDQLMPESERSDNFFADAQEIVNTEIPLISAYRELIKQK